MNTIFASLGAWNWIVAGLLLLVVEVIAPGAFMMWLGIAALMVGMLSLAIDWSWQAQSVAFALFAVASIPIWRKFGRDAGQASDRPFLNRRTSGLVGRVCTLDQPIIGGAGRVRIDDTIWQVTGPDNPAGSRVRVTGSDGSTLTVVRDS